MSPLHACFPVFTAALLSTACVATNADLLGDLETSDDASTGSDGSSGTTAGDPVGDTADTVCDPIVGTTFSSIEEIVCAPPQEEGEEPLLCHSWIEFAEDGTFLWMEADYGQGGTYTCEGGVLALEGLDVDFSFDPATSILTWDGVEYQPDVLCEQIVGTTFLSLEELECGLTPDGPELCHWQITFEEDGNYLWMHSDVGEGGTYVCQGGNFFVVGGSDVDFDVDPVTGILTWDGVEYEAAP